MNLDRRAFFKTAALASVAAVIAPELAAAEPAAPKAPAPGRDYYELRAYRLRPGATAALLDAYFERALIPALNARGVKAVGVFTEPDASDGAAVWVLIPYPSLEAVASVTSSINGDQAFQAASAEYVSAPSRANPTFDRLDSWLLLAFSGMPTFAVPALAKAGKARIFEMRTYESYSEAKAQNKVDMFNDGEIELMQDLELSPVFYGQGRIGRDLPHLTYMLCSPDRETHAKNWTRFTKHPIWEKLKSDPRYADNVSKVVKRIMVPTSYSQI